jgi:predicted transcriptional regulator
MEYIRREVFKASQEAMATIAGVTQSTVSRWEKGELEPDRWQMERIRDAARSRSIPWKDKWFFEAAA